MTRLLELRLLPSEVGDIAARARSIAICGVSTAFAVTLLCIAVIAATWDTPYRVWAVAILALVFALIAGIAAWQLAGPRSRNDATRQPEEPPRSIESSTLVLAAAFAGGVLIARPGLLRSLARIVPVAALSRFVLERYLVENPEWLRVVRGGFAAKRE